MKLNKLPLVLSLTLICAAFNANAGIVVKAAVTDKTDICEKIAGDWTGKGTAVVWGVITCVYDGKMQINNPAPGELAITNLVLEKRAKESSKLCPARETLDLPGTCHNGKIIIKSDIAKLDGDLTPEANAAKLNGTVTFTVPVIGKITPNVDMDINKT